MAQRKKANDAEKKKHISTSLDGFPQTAKFITRDIDKAAAIFRRFDTLSYRNLLYLQSKLAVLQEKQADYDAKDAKERSDDTVRCATSWEDFEYFGNITSDDEAESPQHKRWKLAQDIQSSLKDYKEALLLHSQTLSLGRPADRTIEAFRDWFENRDGKGPGGKDGYPQLRGIEATIYENEDDLVSLFTPLEEDFVTRFVTKFFGWMFITAGSDDKTVYISRRNVNRFVTFFGTVASIAFLVGAMWALSAVEPAVDMNFRRKMGIVTGFVAGFALWVGLLTSARRAEIFAASAAYAAVLVVYVGKA